MNNLGMSQQSEIDSKISVEIKCNIEGDLSNLFLIFSTDNAHSWYSVKMNNLGHSYSITLPNVPFGNKILYLFKIVGSDGKEYIDDNNGQYYFEIAGQKEVLYEESIPNKNENSDAKISASNNKLTAEESIIENVVQDLIVGEETMILERSSVDKQEFNRSASSHNIKSSENEIIENDANTHKISHINQPIEEEGTNSQIDSSKVIRPIIPYNPFSADYGDLESSQNALLSFSQIIDGRMTSPPKKKNSYLKNVQVLETNKKCAICKANMNNNWKICPICGSKN
ncbi:hypothetical protein NEF87_002622 [Candidatus Lokiarchaeum ossiferum]|uniref:CBM20 domain-containing protein n=1 Tax=Candidatus Lokiarchaeum ossiferum TaxID=2951803 RepID=A0ABY6HS43_9ARCH|nr:hypothetical protein NEF87_002622 [Candidatus Lokiarchaeum sp. B-35]